MHLTHRLTLSAMAVTAIRPPTRAGDLRVKPCLTSMPRAASSSCSTPRTLRYSNLYGVRVGTTTAVAEALMHRLVIGGCFDGMRVNTKTSFLVMWFEGGKNRVHPHPYYLYAVGGHVAFIVVHSQRLNPGVLDCIDS